MSETYANYKRLPGETPPSRMAAIALVMSILVHVAIWVLVAEVPLGRLDAAVADDRKDSIVIVTETQVDPIFDDPILTGSGEGPVEVKQMGIGEMSKRLLHNHPITNTQDIDPTKEQPKHSNFEDQQPNDPRPDLLTHSPEVKRPDDFSANLASGIKVKSPVVGTGSTSTPNPSGAGDRGPSASDTARSFLKGKGLAIALPKSPAPVAPLPTSPIADDTDTGVDRNLLSRTSSAPPIEVAKITVQEALKVEVPQNLDEDFNYIITKHRPTIGGGLFQSAKPDTYSYFRVDIAAKRSLRKLKSMPKDVVYVIDTSGSVPQTWVNAVTSGVKDALGSLNEGDRFNICFFSEKSSLFSTRGIQPATRQNIATAQQFLGRAQSDGSTDVNRALSQLLVRDTSAQRAYYLILISDGIPTQGVMDTRELINLVTRDNDLAASIYCVGVGNRQNKELLNFLAYRNKGFSVFTKSSNEATSQIRNLASRIRYPLIKDVTLNVIGLDMAEVFPHNLPNVHQGEHFSIYGRYINPVKFNMRLAGHNGQRRMDFTFGGDLRAAPEGEKTIPATWGFWKLHHIYSEIIRKGKSSQLQNEIDALKKRFDLKTLY